MYDVTQTTSFMAVRDWLEQVQVRPICNANHPFWRGLHSHRWNIPMRWNGTSPEIWPLSTLTLVYSHVYSFFWQKNKADDACVMLLGNKMDLEEGGGRQVTTMQGQKLAEVIHTEIFLLYWSFIWCVYVLVSLCVRSTRLSSLNAVLKVAVISKRPWHIWLGENQYCIILSIILYKFFFSEKFELDQCVPRF